MPLSPFADFFETTPLRELPEGEVVFAQGDAADGHMYALLEGSVRLARDGVVLEEVSQGGVFGELALIDREARSATATTLARSRLAVITEERFRELLLRNPSFGLEMMRLLARRTRFNLRA
jgi:CRP/FNR family cyclic AMP-dependent transcriptional regulator